MRAPIDSFIIDGYVWLGENRGGLGLHLYQALQQVVPVIGVAKTRFQGCENWAIPVWRGAGKNPLWITAIGIAPTDAAQQIGRMVGDFRIPTLLKRVDAACRDWSTS